MSTQQAALENLRVIRSLMEKAHIYRAISVKAALSGGGFALFLASRGILAETDGRAGPSSTEFLASWLALLVVVTTINLWHLSREAKLREQTLVSAGMRMALKAVTPALLAGGIFGCGLAIHFHNLSLTAFIWTTCYGLALLSASGFSPQSLVRLGWMFLATGLLLFWLWSSNSEYLPMLSDARIASITMGLTFGLLHIGYGIAVLFSKKPEPLPAE